MGLRRSVRRRFHPRQLPEGRRGHPGSAQPLTGRHATRPFVYGRLGRATQSHAATADRQSRRRAELGFGAGLDDLDPGALLIESRIPTEDFEKVLKSSEREYPGFSSGLRGSTEVVLRTPEQIELLPGICLVSAMRTREEMERLAKSRFEATVPTEHAHIPVQAIEFILDLFT